MNPKKKLLILAVLNASIVMWCLFYYFQGISLWRVAVAFVVFSIGFNLLAQRSLRRAMRGKNESAAAKQA